MSGPLCAGRDPEMWSTGNELNRLAVMVCRRCTGCPPGSDPSPHGVIRQGIAYSDSGNPLPECPNCLAPNVDYAGGSHGLCRACRVPDVDIPDPQQMRTRRVRHLLTRGVPAPDIAAELQIGVTTVYRIRTRINNQPLTQGEAA